MWERTDLRSKQPRLSPRGVGSRSAASCRPYSLRSERWFKKAVLVMRRSLILRSGERARAAEALQAFAQPAHLGHQRVEAALLLPHDLAELLDLLLLQRVAGFELVESFGVGHGRSRARGEGRWAGVVSDLVAS